MAAAQSSECPVRVTRVVWDVVANVSSEQQVFVNMQSKSQMGRDKIIEHIINEVGSFLQVDVAGTGVLMLQDWLKHLIGVFDQAEDLESLEDIHAVSNIVHILCAYHAYRTAGES